MLFDIISGKEKADSGEIIFGKTIGKANQNQFQL